MKKTKVKAFQRVDTARVKARGRSKLFMFEWTDEGGKKRLGGDVTGSRTLRVS